MLDGSILSHLKSSKAISGFAKAADRLEGSNTAFGRQPLSEALPNKPPQFGLFSSRCAAAVGAKRLTHM
jgi:hypothetical protein